MRTLEQKAQPFAFGCSFEPHEYFWIIFCLEKPNPPPEQPFFPVCKAQALSLPGPAVAEQAALEVTLVFHPCKLSQPHITHRSKPSLLPWHLLQEAKGTLDPAPRLNPKYSSFTRSLSSMKGALAQPHKIPQDKNHPRVHLDDGKHSGITAHTAKQNISPISLSTTCI